MSHRYKSRCTQPFSLRRWDCTCSPLNNRNKPLDSSVITWKRRSSSYEQWAEGEEDASLASYRQDVGTPASQQVRQGGGSIAAVSWAGDPRGEWAPYGGAGGCSGPGGDVAHLPHVAAATAPHHGSSTEVLPCLLVLSSSEVLGGFISLSFVFLFYS